MFTKRLYPILLVFLTLLSCSKSPEEPQLDPDTQTLVDILLDEMDLLAADPLSWEDEDLRWLDPMAGKSVVGLGEATHGTAEFFDAKHRIFRYLVENHGYKVFAFEADFGESLFLNEAVQQGNVAEIESLMESKMHFWTWKTEEVKDLLEWMCSYNQGKSDEDKVHYMGVDCQFNTYHPDMAQEYLDKADLPFREHADSILQIAETESELNFDFYDQGSFDTFLQKLDALQDSMVAYRDVLVTASSEKEFKLNTRIIRVISQVCKVKYNIANMATYSDLRDKYMAENTTWMLDYFENEKIAVWAHNYHVSIFESGVLGTMGNYLHYALGDQYANIGFLFSHGTYTAVGMEGSTYTELGEQSLDASPKENSLNAMMSYTGQDAFSVEVESLRSYLTWYNALEAGMQYFFMGSAYNNRPGDYYVNFDPDLYHYLIYFVNSTASELL